MQAAREWAAALCAGAVMCAAFGIIRTQGRQSKALKIVLSSAMLCLLVSPLGRISECTKQVRNFVSVPSEPDKRLCSTIEKQTSYVIEDAVKQLVRQYAESLGLHAGEIYVATDISDDGCISIGQVDVVMEQGRQSDAEKMRDGLCSEYGFNAKVVLPEEENGH